MVFTIFWIFLIVLSTPSKAAQILLMPSNHVGSHVMFFSRVGKTLQQAGHKIKILLVDNERKHAVKQGLDTISLGNTPVMTAEEMENVYLDVSLFKLLPMLISKSRTLCELFLEQETLMESLEQERFDLVIIDSFDMFRCMYVIPYRLDVPYITMSYRHDPWTARVPALPSVEGQFAKVALTENSTFVERLKNFVITILAYILMPVSSMTDPQYVVRYAPNKPPLTLMEIYQNSEMWIINMETLCLDFPRVHAHHYRFIGGLGCEPAQPLPKEMDNFAQSSHEHSVIVMTFGSVYSTIPAQMMHKFMAAFNKIPQHVFMRYDGPPPENRPDNVYLSKWLPQNDLLGHPKTKLFISHGGNNGQLEALYHGVPLLTMPISGDQFYSSERSEIHGYGLSFDHRTFTSEELVSKIKEIITNSKYRDNIKHSSDIFHSLPKAQDELTFWVNHVLKFGGSHLKPVSMDMPLWQYFMLDMLAFILVITGIILMAVWFCCTKLYNRCNVKYKKE